MRRLLSFAAVCAAAWATACNPAGDPSVPPIVVEDGVTPLDEREGPNMGTATLKQFLIDPDDAPDCNEVRSGCLNDQDYAYCVWQVEGSDAGDPIWLDGGSCNSGYECEEYRVDGMDAARCVREGSGGGGGSGDRSIDCVATGSDDHLRCTIEGDLLGGLVATPTRPTRVLYGADPIDGEDDDSWTVPYPSGTVRDYASYSTSRPEGPWVIDLEPEVENFNFYVQDSSSSSRNSWVDIPDGDWDFSGDIEVDGDRLVRSDGGGGGGGGGGDGEVDIDCDLTSSNLVVAVSGDLLDHLIDGTVSSPRQVLWGGNRPSAVWSVSGMTASSRAKATWTSSTTSATLRLPRDADHFNLFVLGSGTSGKWVNLNTDGDHVNVTGDCRIQGTLIYVRR